jgi:NAD(P)-dependent dehydrogenase (short-subunit alcohol dehydrogenase family)
MQPQKIFLTGASSGIGQALARAYAEQGAMLASSAGARMRCALCRQPAQSRAVRVYAADVRDADAMQAAAADFWPMSAVPTW